MLPLVGRSHSDMAAFPTSSPDPLRFELNGTPTPVGDDPRPSLAGQGGDDQ